MLNLLEDYICRSVPESGKFATNPNLNMKVDFQGHFLPFVGNTVVFELEERDKIFLKGLQKKLYDETGEILAQKLDSDTFHMTLHDLENTGRGAEGLEERMKHIRDKVIPVLKEWKCHPELSMKTTWLFNMVNTSIVLGLVPEDEASDKALCQMYDCLEEVLPLGYALTPHITMAYFKPGAFSSKHLDRLRAALYPVEYHLKLRAPVYRRFNDMNRYY